MESFFQRIGIDFTSNWCILPILFYTCVLLFGMNMAVQTTNLKTQLDKSIETADYWKDMYQNNPRIVHDTTYILEAVESEVLLLARLIESEAASEPIAGKLGVGEVTINRQQYKFLKELKKRCDCSYDLERIIYAKGQFDGIKTKHFKRKPSAQSRLAAKAALLGSKTLPDNIYYFANEAISSDTKWIAYLNNSGRRFKTIKNHTFYSR